MSVMFLSWGGGDAEQSGTDGGRGEGDPSGLFDRNLYDVHGMLLFMPDDDPVTSNLLNLT